MAYAILAAVAFLLHLAWESAHFGLYRNFDALKGVLPVPLWAALGDVLYTFIVVGLVALAKGNVFWFASSSALDYLLLAVYGLITSLFVEYKAAYYKRWEYSEKMPLLPILNTGATSALQKIILFPLSVCITALMLASI